MNARIWTSPPARPRVVPEDVEEPTVVACKCGESLVDGKCPKRCRPAKRRLCTSCWRPGHNRATCDGPYTENDMAAGGAP